MGKRQDLQAELESILGSKNVYYQPPESVSLKYPCIVYKKDRIEAKYANDRKYANSTRYQVTTMELNPDAEWQDGIFTMPLCSHSRNYVKDGLHHDIFDLYY